MSDEKKDKMDSNMKDESKNKPAEGAAEVKSTSSEPTTASELNSFLANKNAKLMALGAVLFVVLVAAIIAIVVLAKDDDDSSSKADGKFQEYDGEEYSFEYPESWELDDDYGITLQPKEQIERLEAQEEDQDEDFSFDDLEDLDLDSITVTVTELFGTDVVDLVKDGNCEEAIDEASGGIDLGQETSDVDSFELNGFAACSYSSTVEFFFTINGYSYIVVNDETAYTIAVAEIGERNDKEYDRAMAVLDSFTLK